MSLIAQIRTELSRLRGEYGGDAYLSSPEPLGFHLEFEKAADGAYQALNADGACMSHVDRSGNDFREFWRDVKQGLPPSWGFSCRGYFKVLGRELIGLGKAANRIQPGAGETMIGLAESVAGVQAEREQVTPGFRDFWNEIPGPVKILIVGGAGLITLRALGLELEPTGQAVGGTVRAGFDSIRNQIEART